MDPKKLITITQENYDSLIQDQNLLRALQAGGVDDWEWYGDALNSLKKDGESNVQS